MKKLIITLSMALILITGVITPVFSDTFVPSIGVRDDVILVSDPIIVYDDECEEELIVTPYIRKVDIESELSEQQLEESYAKILSVEDVGELCEDIIPIAHSLGVETQDLVVRDLFDITAYEHHVSDHHVIEQHDKYYNVTLKVDSLENYVALMVYYDNEWHIVENVEVIRDENLLKFLTNELSPFALIVATDYRYVASAHGCIWHLYICITMILTFIIIQCIRTNKDSETSDKKKKNILIRDIILLISLILSIVFYIFGTCKYDIYVLIAELVVITIAFIYTHPHNKDE